MTDTTSETDETTTAEAAPPLVTITRGQANAEEVAALTVLFAALGGSDGAGEPNLRRGWSRPARRLGGNFAARSGWGRL